MVSFIEFPIFDGVSGDLRPWISWLEDFFVRENFTADEKMNLAQSLLEGEAEAWFYSSQKRFAFQSWEHLMDLLIWRFGDFSDPELFLLFDKNDRLLQEQRVEAKRMSRTAIAPHESIPLLATIHETIPVEKFSTQQVDEISGAKKESKKEVDLSLGKIASQLKSTLELQPLNEIDVTLPNTKVHVSDSENLRNIETMAENSVLDNFDTVVMKAKIQKNIRMDVVNGDVERIQRVMSITKNVSAHQVLDKMCQLKGLETKKKMKVLKSWMFKYKPKRRRRRKRHNQDWFNTLSRRESWRKHKHENLQIVSGLLGFNEVSFRCHKEYGLARMNNWSQVRAEYSLMQGKLFVRNDFPSDGILDGDIAKLLNSIGDKLQSYGYVLEITFLRRLRVHQQQQRRKSTKSWRFKYKSRLKNIKLTDTKFLRNTRFTSREMKQFVGFMTFQLKHKWRSKNLHIISAWEFYLSSVFSTVTSANSCRGYKRMHEQLQVHTILIVNDVKSQVKHKWRLVWRLWRLHNQWFVLVILQLREPYGWSGARGLGQLILDDLKSYMRHKWNSKHLQAVVGLQNSLSYALDVVTQPVTECNTTAAIFQLVLERSVSHDCFLGSLWEKKNVSWLGVVCVLAEGMMLKATVISAKLPETIRGREGYRLGAAAGGVRADYTLEQ